MAPLIAHIVVGERVFARMASPDATTWPYGPFLLGCVLADVNSFAEIDRRRTHFVDRPAFDGEDAFNQNCTRFLRQLSSLLPRPWKELAGGDQAFVGGYLCHLAADEVSNRFTWELMHGLGVDSWTHIPAPPGVVSTAFGVLTRQELQRPEAVSSALAGVAVPNVLAHVPHSAFQCMWEIVRDHVSDGRTPASYFDLLERQGRPKSEVEAVRQRHERYWDRAVALIRGAGGPERYLRAAVERGLEMMPRLWTG
jgi:hypothetical protein